VGRLAGGVAHDFNNLLTVINGYADFLLAGLEPDNPMRASAGEIRAAGDRAASLTKQLLAFSRKQVIEPKVTDLNQEIRGSEGMLQRLIGEDILLTTRLDSALGLTLADAEQLQQVIMNLVVNARDAMKNGGRIDITTRNLEVSDDGAAHPDAKPGQYVMLTVADNGTGMDENTRQHIFEPFFTTKGPDKGTGLGLSTVYGIVRQSGGWIDITTEVGMGSSFNICLPRIDSPERARRDGPPAGEWRSSGETILVVEDQEAVRRLTTSLLREYGYQLLEASDGTDALRIAKEYGGEIDLVLTDVVLPGINGKELSERLQELRPGLKVLFTSGYTADAIGDRGILAEGLAYIPKPFSGGEMAAKIRDVLRSRNSG